MGELTHSVCSRNISKCSSVKDVLYKSTIRVSPGHEPPHQRIREVTGLNWEHSLPSTDFVVYHSLGTKLRYFAREGGRKSKHTFTPFHDLFS